jgi:ribosomal protein S18 acetylase RimI-like enzyme
MTSGALTSSITIRRATPADAARLASFAATAFTDTFAADNRPEDMAAYLAESFGEAQQRAELEDPAVTVLLAEKDDALVGYAMLRDGDVAEPVASARGRGRGRAIEIARLYAGKRWIGAGIGALLMQRCLDEARARAKDTIWLGVWERNARAIAFYRRWGFADVGSQSFQLGSDLQTDRVMARRATEE